MSSDSNPEICRLFSLLSPFLHHCLFGCLLRPFPIPRCNHLFLFILFRLCFLQLLPELLLLAQLLLVWLYIDLRLLCCSHLLLKFIDLSAIDECAHLARVHGVALGTDFDLNIFHSPRNLKYSAARRAGHFCILMHLRMDIRLHSGGILGKTRTLVTGFSSFSAWILLLSVERASL